MKSSVLVAAMSATMLLVTPLAHAELIKFHAKLSGLNEAPSNASPGIGFAEIEFDTTAHTMHVTADFSGLLGTVTAAHIHCCTPLPLTSTAGVATTTPTFPGFPSGQSVSRRRDPRLSGSRAGHAQPAGPGTGCRPDFAPPPAHLISPTLAGGR